MNKKIHVALIYGSTREGRFCDTIVKWAVTEMAARDEFVLDLVDPAALNLALHHRQKADSELIGLTRRIGLADAFIIATPEYNHGYPAALKFLIDSIHHEWQAKPVSFISYGGISGGLRAVEQLRLVFAELHAVTIRECVSFSNPWSKFDADGRFTDQQGASKAMHAMLDRLLWWARWLREARKAAPYGEIAA